MNKHVKITLPNGQIVDLKKNPLFICEKPYQQRPPPINFIPNQYYEEYDYVDFDDPLLPVNTYEPRFPTPPPPKICTYEPIQSRSLYKQPREVYNTYDDIYEQPQFDLF